VDVLEPSAVAPPGSAAGSEELLQQSWADRGRAVRGRELRLELTTTAAFGAAVIVLLLLAPAARGPAPAAALAVLAYAIAARSDFPIGSGHMVPTQLFLVPLFALAPAPLVPLLVFAGLAAGLLGDAALGRARLDRLAYCGGDALHSVGPALVLVLLAGGDALDAPPEVLLLAFAAQLVFDFGSSSLHDLMVFGTRPQLHVKVTAQVWSVDAALTPLGLLVAKAAQTMPLALAVPLPVVAVIVAMSADRSRRIGHAQERLEALRRERRRREAAVQRVGDALASNLDRAAMLELVGRAATDALDGDAGRAIELGARQPPPGPEGVQGRLLADVELRAPGAAPAPAEVSEGDQHAIAGVIGDPAGPVGVLSVVRDAPFSAEERSLLAHLCGQAAVSAANVVRHEKLREAETRLRHQAFHDALTGLPNRSLFAERVTHALERTDRLVAVLLLDLDGFKLVNDTLGHDAGDELLVATAQRIRTCMRGADNAARLGGDEFAVMLEGLESPLEAQQIGERLRLALRVPILVRDREFVVRASIGIAYPELDTEPAEVLRRADLAMYAAKSGGGDRVAVFAGEMLSLAEARTELANDLVSAAALGQLELLFQPIVDLDDGRPRAVEALARWRHPRRGLLEPAAFIGLAEQTGAIESLGRCVLDEACRIAAGWADALQDPPDVTVNVSAAQLRLETFARDVTASLTDHGLPARRLVLEVTESTAMATDGETRTTLAALLRLGVRLALDDFGTGYSSLSSLARTKVDMLKLDREFIAGIDTDDAQARLAGGVIGLAASLGVSIVAAGIERPEELERVRRLGGRLGQGFLLGRPMDEAALARHLLGDPPAVRERSAAPVR